jgi:hypothetical protein
LEKGFKKINIIILKLPFGLFNTAANSGSIGIPINLDILPASFFF